MPWEAEVGISEFEAVSSTERHPKQPVLYRESLSLNNKTKQNLRRKKPDREGR